MGMIKSHGRSLINFSLLAQSKLSNVIIVVRRIKGVTFDNAIWEVFIVRSGWT